MITRTVEKTFKFDAAHRLVGFDGKRIVTYKDNCRNLHGHTYTVKIKIKLKLGHVLDHYGMVYDYNKMKMIKNWIDKNLDHATLVSSYDKPLLKFLRNQKGRDKHYILETPATAENIAALIFKKAQEVLNCDKDDVHRVVIDEVSVNETATSEAVYRED